MQTTLNKTETEKLIKQLVETQTGKKVKSVSISVSIGYHGYYDEKGADFDGCTIVYEEDDLKKILG